MRTIYPKPIHLPAEIMTDDRYLYIVVKVQDMRLAVRFSSPEQLLEFFQGLMENAVKVWPENEWVKEYLREKKDVEYFGTEIAPGVIAHISPDADPKTIESLKQLAETIKKQEGSE